MEGPGRRGKKHFRMGSRRVLTVLKDALLKSDTVRKETRDDARKNIEFLQESSIVVENGITKSALDAREYRLITLPNGLEALLIHDDRVILSGAALNVNAGSYSDPEDMPGMMHFLEHMLFMGTEKYPGENDFDKYLSEHGGWSNAHTLADTTSYFFQISSEYFETALDMFAQLFVSPLLHANAAEREVEAVDSENTDKSREDNFRRYQVLQEVSDPRHPFHKFIIGNRETLSINRDDTSEEIVAALREHFDRFYSANNMKLAVLGGEDMETLEAWALEYFGPIQNKRLQPLYDPTQYPPAFGPDRLASRLDIVPIDSSMKVLCFHWFLQPISGNRQMVDQLSLLSELIGDEGPGSIISVLRDRNLATTLMAGSTWHEFSFTDFVLSIECTSEGINERLEEIVKLVFDYIQLIKSNLHRMEWVLQEHQALGYIHYWFKANEETMGFIGDLAERMQRNFSRAELLADDFLLNLNHDSLAGIQSFAEQLTVDKMILEVVQDGAAAVADKTERWSGVSYACSKLSPAFKDLCNGRHAPPKDLKLPKRNPYVPKTFTVYDFQEPTPVLPPANVPTLFHKAASRLCTPVPIDFNGSSLANARVALKNCALLEISSKWDDEYDLWRCPALIKANECTALWLKQDTMFRRPEEMITCVLDTQVIGESLRTAAMTEVYITLATEMLQENTYAAAVAGLTYNVSYNENSIVLRYAGYSDTLFKLQRAVSKSLTDSKIFTKARFERIRTLLVNTFRQREKEEPQMLCMKMTRLILSSRGYSDEEVAEEMERLTCKDISKHVKRLYQKVSLEMYVHGNANPEQAEKVFGVAVKAFRPTKPFAEPRDKRTVKLEKQRQYYYFLPSVDSGNPSSALVVTFQCGKYKSRTAAQLAVLTSFLHESFFNHLRTKQQLGYNVWAQDVVMNGVHQLHLVVQSKNTDPFGLDKHVETFLEAFYTELHSLTASDLEAVITSCIANIIRIPYNMHDEARKWAQAFVSKQYDLHNSVVDMASALCDVTVRKLISFFETYISAAARSRRKFVCGVLSDVHAQEVFGASANLKVWKRAGRIPKAAVLPKLQVTSKAGWIISVEDRRLFRSQATFYPSMPDTLRQR